MFDHLTIGVILFAVATSLASLLITAVLVRLTLVRLPADYLLHETASASADRANQSFWKRGARNLVAILFLIAGFAMLFLPGQGLLTMALGLVLLDLPGKKKWERRLLGRPGILRQVNRLRRRAGQPELRTKPRSSTE